MREKAIITIILAILIIGIITITATTTINFEETNNTTNNTTDNETLNETNTTEKNTTEKATTTKNSNSKTNSDPNIISTEYKQNDQDDGSYYKEINYKDGNFRQYDTNGKLIGSSYDSDQSKLPSMA